MEGATDAKDVGLIECHGTGTALGDPIEVDALKGVFGEHLVGEISWVIWYCWWKKSPGQPPGK